MFSKNKQPPLKSLIAEGCRVEGHVSFSEGLRVEGAIAGDIRAQDGVPSMLVITEHASVQGVIVADHVVINGQVRGPIHARLMLEIQPKARIEGDIEYAALEMHQGALITGQLKPLLDIEDKPTLKLAASNL